MKFLPMKDLLDKALREGYAVPAFCVWNAESMDVVLKTCSRLRSPVILMNGPSEFELLHPHLMAKVARSVADFYDIPAALHVDHGDSVELIKEAIDAGYTSVMLDFSARPFIENVNALREICRMAHLLGITVEGEIGMVGKMDNTTEEGGKSSTLTNPEEAGEYLRQTGIDALAISIGNVHGNYTSLPRLDFDRLKKIHARCGIPLVLHGGSGTPEEDVRKAVSLGIAKINVASELIRSVRDTLMNLWMNNKALWVPVADSEAMKSMSPIVEKWIHKSGSAGKMDFKED
ncbi:MAG: D-tagatose-1,6-bisphosphate aldolase subunit GatY [Smithella sp. PtaU1.Bin162]|nr:MAG: D-tagatose-1,6-bisphosphate aldolase subunit GatY [Smithella sp. PtaU1.Bin162]